MAIIETTWSPTASNIEKKNTKSALSWAIIRIWRAMENCTDKEKRDEINKILFEVL